MAVVVPDAGRLADVVKDFDGDFVRTVLTGCSPPASALRLPRWTFRTQVLLNDVLGGLGMPTAFTPPRGLLRDDAVDGQLEIAGRRARGVHRRRRGGHGGRRGNRRRDARVRQRGRPDVELTVDRPFLFVLHDTATGTPLFIGRVSDPTARVTARRITEPQKNNAATPNSHQFRA